MSASCRTFRCSQNGSQITLAPVQDFAGDGPYGAKGVGEIGLVPTAGAVANALYQFDGLRRTKLPMALPKRRR